MTKKTTFLILLFSFFCSSHALAHPMPNSIVNLKIGNKSIQGVAKIPVIELESAIQKLIPIQTDSLKNYFQQHIRAFSSNQFWETTIENIDIISEKDAIVGNYQEAIVTFKITPPSIQHLRQFDFRYDAVIHQVVTHQIMVFITEDAQNGIYEESGQHQQIGVIEIDIPTGNIKTLPIRIGEGSLWKSFLGMTALGMQHIREGLDHFLFLLSLLLVAPLAVSGEKWSLFQGWEYTLRRFWRISLAFTIGHSAMLLLGAFNWVLVNVQLIEILIAVSILITAVHAIRPIFKANEPRIALLFGLIHGLAFSFSLTGLELDSTTKLVSILGFNLGIELMQLIIMLLFLPIILLSKFKFYNILRTGLAVFTLLASVAWVWERVTGEANFLTQFLSLITKI